MKHLYLFALLFLFQIPLQATHIVGGVISYECLGGGTYRFTTKMYRDCSNNNTNQTGFDNTASFTIFKGQNPTPLDVVYVGIQIVENVEQPDNPCLEEIPPSQICVEEALYEFEYTFTDWPSDEPYHITLQRCCRNPSISNLQTPEDIGLTLTTEVTPASQSFCNNSPTFNTFPPIVICAGEPLEYDHSAFDAEGDQLIYEFCSPLLGGAPGGGQVIPDPDAPPPYTGASFVNPPYSPLNPMGGNPTVGIDPVTGLLTGTPIIEGQFVVTVCVSEFRDGQLLSTIRRDFQFNVTQCDPNINATVSAPGILVDNDEYMLENCNDLNIFLDNTSTSQSMVDSFFWQFSNMDTTFFSFDWDLNLEFPATGSYTGLLALNPNSDCGDTATVSIEIYPEIVPEFTYEYDTCFAGPVSFKNESFINGPGLIDSLYWSFGDGTTDSVQNNPVHLYSEPDILPVQLEIFDTNGCMASISKTVIYQPVPSLILVRPNDTISCPPTDILFTNLSSPIDDNYEISWDFGDGKTSSAFSPVHRYEEAGLYDVTLTILSPIGCFYDTTFVGLVEVLPPPIASFNYTPRALSNLVPEVNFIDQSIDAARWDWFVDGEIFSNDREPNYVFPDTGLHEVVLVVTHPEKCQDTTVQIIDVEPKVTYHMPNAFTPNEDTNNDYFLGTGITRGVTDFRMEIWDRWGKKIFETTEVDGAWNGRVNNTGKQVQEGVYVCIVSFTGPRGEPFEYRGYASVLR